MIAHGGVVTSSHQITEDKQCPALLVHGWVTSAQVMSRGIGQASRTMLPLSTQQ